MTELSAQRIASIKVHQELSANRAMQALDARISIIDGNRTGDRVITCNVASNEAHLAGVWSRLLLGAVEA